MERKRKGYLLRKSDAQRKQHQSIPPLASNNGPPSNQVVCNGNSPACRSYDLQTQTVTFGDESDTQMEMQEVDNEQKMECDGLEFYPVAEGASPCTFSAWDAFLSGSCQAFFREPFMAAIPEEEESLLYTSDTDDTGSSVSTVVERSYFDLEKVLSPFERLEKELDAHSKDDQKDIPHRGPIVVITNSSSCEDVHSEPDDPKTNRADPPPLDTTETPPTATNELPPVPSRSKVINGHRSKQESKSTQEKPPSEKTKRTKSEKITPPGANKKSRPSYPTPSVPPRMSTHLPARRTRSDPGSPDTPSRIPRPIGKVQGSPKGAPKSGKKGSAAKKLAFERSNVGSRSSSNNSKGSVDGASLSEPECSGSNNEKPDILVKKSTEINDSVIGGLFQTDSSDAIVNEPVSLEGSSQEMIVMQSDETDVSSMQTYSNQSDSSQKESSEIDSEVLSLTDTDSKEQDSANKAVDSDVSRTCNLMEGLEEEKVACSSDVFEVTTAEVTQCTDICDLLSENTEEVEKSSNKEDSIKGEVVEESTPALQPKAQIAAAINPPPIPERPSLLATKKPELKTADHTANEEASFWPAASRPIEDILSALDQLVAPEEWTPSSLLPASTVEGSGEDGLDVEDLLREVQKTLGSSLQGEEASSEVVRTPPLGPGTPDVPTAGTTANHGTVNTNLSHQHHDLSSDHPSPDMLRHAHHLFSSTLVDDPKHPQHSPGCDDSGVFLEEPHSEDDPGLASSSVDSADDLESFPPPVTRKPPPVPARRRGTKGSSDSDSTFGEGDEVDQPPKGGKYSTSEDESVHRDVDYLKNRSKYSILDGGKENGYQTKSYSFEEELVYGRNQTNHSSQMGNGYYSKNQTVGSVEEIREKYSLEPSVRDDLEFPAKNRTKFSHQKGCNENGYHSKARSKYPIDDEEKSDYEVDTRFSEDNLIPVKVETRKYTEEDTPKENGYHHMKNNFPKLSVEDDLGRNTTVPVREDFEDINKKSALQAKVSGSSGYASSKYSLEDLSKDTPVRTSKNRLEDIYSSKFSCEDLRKDSQSRTSKNKLEVPSSQSNSLKWKSEECLRTAGESKWTVRPRFGEKGVSVKDRIAMFSVMESSSSPSGQAAKKDLQRYGSENNIKSIASVENSAKKFDVSPLMEETVDSKSNTLSRDSKWQSMQNIDKKKDSTSPSYSSSATIKPALSIPSMLENNTNSASVFPLKFEVESSKPIVSTYPEAQLTTNSKRYNTGLYSLKSLKQTEDLLSKKAAGTTSLLSSIINKPPLTGKLKGLVIPERPTDGPPKSTVPPTILSNDSTDSARRGSLPVTIVTASNSRSKLVEPPWKAPSSNNSNTLPRYGAGNSYRRGLDGGSLSPASPLSSPSSVSSVQQNVFQFSLSHSKPVKPLKPEKALMSPPSEMESVVPRMAPKEDPEPPPRPASPPPRTAPLAFTTTSTKSSALQPLLVEALVKPSNPPSAPPRAAVCISKTEIHLRGVDSPKTEPKATRHSSIEEREMQTPNGRLNKLLYSSKSVDYIDSSTKISNVIQSTDNRNIFQSTDIPNDKPSMEVSHGRLDKLVYSVSMDYTDVSSKSLYQEADKDLPSKPVEAVMTPIHTNGDRFHKSSDYVTLNGKSDNDIQMPDQFFHEKSASLLINNTKPVFIHTVEENPLYLMTDSSVNDEDKSKSVKSTDILAKSLYQQSTIESRSSCQVVTEPPYKSTVEIIPHPDLYSNDSRSYKSDPNRWSSTGRFRASPLQLLGRDRRPLMTPSECDDSDECLSDGLDPRRPFDDSASTEGYLSDASTDVSLRRFTTTRPNIDAYSASEEYLSDATAESPDPEWSRATVGNSGETRYRGRGEDSDLDLRPKRLSQQRTVLRASAAKPPSAGSVQKFRALAEQWEQRVISPPPTLPSNQITLPVKANTLPSKGLPPSLMPRTTRSHRDNDTWSQSSEELVRASRSDSASSDSSKTTVKEEDVEQKELSNGHAVVPKASWHNEPRSRRGVDFSWSTSRPKTSVSDIRRSFEKETEPPVSISAAVVPAVPTQAPPSVSTTVDVPSSEGIESGLRQLREEGLDSGHLEVLSVSLRREDGIDGGSVGITLAGGADYEVKEITVHKVISGSLADRDGRVRKGDRVLSINGRPLRGVSHGEALHTLKTPGPTVTLVIARPQQANDTHPVAKARPSAVIDGDMVLVELQKDATGLGFSIEGGKDSPQGDRPLLIKRVFKGGAADKEGQLCEGDTVVSVNGHPMANMTRTEAWNYLKKLPEGPVTLHLRKGTPS